MKQGYASVMPNAGFSSGTQSFASIVNDKAGVTSNEV
jgi:hypothetical protein